MALYLVGDLHGCLSPLKRLLDRWRFDPATDRLWLVGDLVNRGPESLATLRFVRNLGAAALSVLGNHDLHLLATVHGLRKPSPRDTLDDILTADDRDELIDWLRHRPLLHHEPLRRLVLVHAGIHPAWPLSMAVELARELEAVLRAPDYATFLARMYGNEPAAWSADLDTAMRQRFAINVFTRMRYCDHSGLLDFSCSGPPASAPAGLVPWYRVPGRQPIDAIIAFGHWSSHPAMSPPYVLPLDRGYVWNGALAAFDVDRRQAFSVRNPLRQAVAA